ncbi:maleate cis-trans isomerase family protein [Sandarakinorhabdus oryzae]|uniref:maleate cis-trans isomerase family protein n=1 Tax=Sandarakinorhabdus oryzae TaxID=2675220 RepID=UPI0012E2F343|nr:hypothetical protein [Sandarakinorhabdus oryzae]
MIAPSARELAPVLAAGGPILDGQPVDIGIDPAARYPDVCSHRLKLGLLLPATNCSMEHELWSLIVRNQQTGLAGIGIHTTNVVTPSPRFGNAEELAAYRDQFLAGLAEAVPVAALAAPDHVILGMSIEHIVAGLADVRAPADAVAAAGQRGVSAWDVAADQALKRLNARRIALLTPFDATGNANATRMFRELGYEVVASFGFACALARHIAHIPDWAKEKAIMQHLAPPGAPVDAIVQCGTNMSMIQVAERLEPVIGRPILGINAGLLWHALRHNGITAPISGGGMLLQHA